MRLNFLRIYNFDYRNEKRKADDPTIEPGKKLRAVGERRLRELAQEVRDTNLRPEAIHKASAQEHRKQGHHDACFITNQMAENPSIATFLRASLKRIDDEQKPSIPPMKSLSRILHHKLPGSCCLFPVKNICLVNSYAS